MFSGAPFPARVASVNAYLGAPIAAALEAGADIVLTGRCVDSALVLGPLMHEFGWRAMITTFSAGSLAGHVIECGVQATGGIHRLAPDRARAGTTWVFPSPNASPTARSC